MSPRPPSPRHTSLLVMLGLVVLASIGAMAWFASRGQNEVPRFPAPSIITNFEQCAAAGHPIGESYPRQCFAPGQTFVEDIAEEDVN